MLNRLLNARICDTIKSKYIMWMKKSSTFTYTIAFAISVNAVGLPSGEGNANDFSTSLSEESFQPSTLILSGATEKSDCQYRFEAKGGIGWYWEQGMDGSKAQTIKVVFGEPLKNLLYLQLFYGNRKFLKKSIKSKSREFTLSLGSDDQYKSITSVNLVSAIAQDINLQRVYAVDVQGNVITDIQQTVCQPEVVSTTYYNIVGKQIPHLTKGINIVKYQMKDGSVKIRKVLLNK